MGDLSQWEGITGPEVRQINEMCDRPIKTRGESLHGLYINPPERKFLYMLKIFSQEDFALKSKL